MREENKVPGCRPDGKLFHLKCIFPLLLQLCFWAAQAQYTYISDRRFFSPDDLVGYDFKPAVKEIPNQSKENLSPGEYSFGITFNNLYVKGEGIQGVYNINHIHPEEYGFKLLLMNARNARLQGHLKIIVNKYNMVESLIFKRSNEEKEIIFYQAPIPEKLREQEKKWFTDRGELRIVSVDSLWDKKVFPFFRIHNDARVQERLQMKDSTVISFEEVITVEEKDKKKKKTKPEEIGSTIFDSLTTNLIHGDSIVSATDAEKKVKITKEQFLVLRSIIQYEDGMREDKTWRYPIRRIIEKEDKKANLHEERYQWEFINDKKETILVYLNGDRTVSSIHIGTKTYLMRGF